MKNVKNFLSWVEISQSALEKNVRAFRKILGKKLLCAVVKANAYGHGLLECAPLLVKSGVDWFAVNSLEEAGALRKIGIRKPIYIFGYVPLHQLDEVPRLACSIVLYNRETVRAFGRLKKPVRVHLKVETGNHRQGVMQEDVLDFARFVLSQNNLILEGISTHFANIEDTADPSYAMRQLQLFKKIIQDLERANIHIPLRHCANTAATLLFPETHCDLARIGIGLYGLWPSLETFQRARKLHKDIRLFPVMTWKTRISQIKNIPKESLIGYGCTYRTKRPTKLAVVPVGYFDGYDRSLSNRAHVLVRSKKAPVLGRVCMNIMMIDVTEISGVRLEDEVTLLGKNGKEEISAQTVGTFAETIHYEIVSRIQSEIPRIVVP